MSAYLAFRNKNTGFNLQSAFWKSRVLTTIITRVTGTKYFEVKLTGAQLKPKF